MKKVDGCTALRLLIEHKEGYHSEYTEENLIELHKKACDFYRYLRKGCRIHKKKADEIFTGIIESTRYELKHEWQESFYFSHNREDKECSTEIDILGAISSISPDEKLTQEHQQEVDAGR